MSISEALIMDEDGIKQAISCATIGRNGLCEVFMWVMSRIFPNG